MARLRRLVVLGCCIACLWPGVFIGHLSGWRASFWLRASLTKGQLKQRDSELIKAFMGR